MISYILIFSIYIKYVNANLLIRKEAKSLSLKGKRRRRRRRRIMYQYIIKYQYGLIFNYIVKNVKEYKKTDIVNYHLNQNIKKIHD